MAVIEIIKLVFGILFLAGGSVLILLAFLIGYKYLIQEKRCSQVVSGTVRRYTLASRGGENSGVHLPIVYYTVNGREYKVTGPQYKGYITVEKTGPARANAAVGWEDGDILQVRRSTRAMAAIRANPMEELYPLYSELPVYYDPKNPKNAYVLRYCNNKWVFWVLLVPGVVLLIADAALLLLL